MDDAYTRPYTIKATIMKRRYPTRKSSFISPVKAEIENHSSIKKITNSENADQVLSTEYNEFKQNDRECKEAKNDEENLKCLLNKENVSSEFVSDKHNVNRNILKKTKNNCSWVHTSKSHEIKDNLLDSESYVIDTGTVVAYGVNILKENTQSIISKNSSDDPAVKISVLEKDAIMNNYEKVELSRYDEKTAYISQSEYDSKMYVEFNERNISDEKFAEESDSYNLEDDQCAFKETQKNNQGQKLSYGIKGFGGVMKPRKPFSRMTPEEYKEFYIRASSERSNEFESDLPEMNDTEIDDIILPIANEFGVFELFITDNEDTNVLIGMRKAELPRCRSILLGINQDIDPDTLSPIRDIDGNVVIFLSELAPSKIDWAIKSLIKLSPENGLPLKLHLPDCKLQMKDIEDFLDCLVMEGINIEGEITIGLNVIDPEVIDHLEDFFFDKYHPNIEGIVIITPAQYWQEYCGNVFWKGYAQSNFWPFGEEFLKQVAAKKTQPHDDCIHTFSSEGNKCQECDHDSTRKIEKETNINNDCNGIIVANLDEIPIGKVIENLKKSEKHMENLQ